MPPSVDQTFDYLALIGLGPADLERLWIPDLHEVIKKRKKEWTGQAINPLYQQQARANLERVRQLEQLLNAPEAFQTYVSYLREVLASQREGHEQELGELISIATAGRRQPLTTTQRELLCREAEERGIPVNIVHELVTRLKLEVVAPESVSGAPQVPYRQPAMERALLAQINRSLKVLGKRSFYEALDLPAGENLSRIAASARLQFEKWSKSLPKTAECVAWEKSMQACLTYLKDEDSRQKYDRGLFNARLDEFLRQVDLVLAAGRLTRESHVQLARVGVQEFGLMSAEVNQCILARGAARGVPVTKPVQVSVQLEGQVRCNRCFGWTPARAATCTHCAGSLIRTCKNPSCGRPVPPGRKVCEHCKLPVGRGGQYAELLKLADLLLDSGIIKPALDACRFAAQALPGPEIDRRVERGTKIRTLLADLRLAISEHRWLAAQKRLQELTVLAPRFAQSGIPTLEEVTQRLVQWRQKLNQLSQQIEDPNTIPELLELLAAWRDAPDLSTRCLILAEKLEAEGKFTAALSLARGVESLGDWKEAARPLVLRLQDLAGHARESEARRDDARRDWERAWNDNRLYSAERAVSVLRELGDDLVSAADAESLRQRLEKVRQEVAAIQQLPPDTSSDQVIARHLVLLRECRDCRESLAALQQLNPAPPESPLNLTVTLEGNRRRIQWSPPAGGKLPSGYVVQRAWGRFGPRQTEAPFIAFPQAGAAASAVTAGTSGGYQFLDEEVAHSGDILRYSVQAVLRGTLETGGHILREYLVQSAPLVSDGILIWHEALGLRARTCVNLTSSGVELQWHRPAGVRELILERWRGQRDEPQPQIERLSGVEGALHRDFTVEPFVPYTYRLRCVYDGPHGEFITAGVCVTAQILKSASDPVAEIPVARSEAALPVAINGEHPLPRESEALTAIVEQAPPLSESESGPRSADDRSNEDPSADHQNPLRRFGLWPPREANSATRP